MTSELNRTYFLLRARRSVSQLVWRRWFSGRASMAPLLGSLMTKSSSSTAISPKGGVTCRRRKCQREVEVEQRFTAKVCSGLTRRAQCQSFAALLTCDPTMYPRPLIKKARVESFSNENGKQSVSIFLSQTNNTQERVFFVQSKRLPPPADGDGKIEDGEHICPLLLNIEVSDDGGSNGGVAGFSNSDQTSSQQQGPEMLREFQQFSRDCNWNPVTTAKATRDSPLWGCRSWQVSLRTRMWCQHS